MIQGEIGKWHRATFGINHSRVLFLLTQKFSEEQDELQCALNDDADTSDTAEELADVLIVCYAIADRLGIDLDAEVKRKFAVVASRADQVQRDKDRSIG